MKVVLINPCFKGIVTTPSLGLGYLASHLVKNGCPEVRVIEPLLESLSQSKVLEITKDYDLIGLVCYTESRFQCFEFAREIKERNPNCLIVIGGPHATALDLQILEYYPFVDIIIRGEGEETLLDLAKGTSHNQIFGMSYRANSGIKRNPDRPLLENLDAINDIFTPLSPGIAGWKDPEVPRTIQKGRSVPLIASRGCPHRCTFCGAPKHWQSKWRGLSAQEMVNRVEHYVKEYGAQYFRFFDALFIGSEEKILHFCDLLEERNLKISFRIDIRVGTKLPVLKKLRQAGCRVVGFGVESGSDPVLRRINKGITRAQIEETIKNCKKLDFWLIGFFMLSLPGETRENICMTLELLRHFHVVNIQFFKIHPGTPFYQELKHKGEIDDSVWFDPNRGINTAYGNEFFYCQELFASSPFSREEAERIIQKAYHGHYLWRPFAAFKTRGYRQGAFKLATSALSRVMLSSSPGTSLYLKLKENWTGTK